MPSMADKSVLGQTKTPNIAPENDGTISVQVLEFKTSLLEVVEELHIRRDAETRHEEQICKLVLEKQELEWQKESLQNQISRMSSENSESLAAIKKQFQAQIRRIEGEKGKIQLAAELKDKEITSLKEELKLLQLLKYSLEKKLAELEQKLQLQTQLKDGHLSQLGEVERRFATVSRQCSLVKQTHEKLEQNVEEAMQINKKLTSINGKQDSTIKALKEDVESLNKELVTFKVASVCKPGEEHLQNILKDQQLEQFQHKLLVETEISKKLRNEAVAERAEKQDVLRSLHHTQRLLQTQTEALIRAEQELHVLQKEYQVLKTEHELNQEKNREKQDSFAQLQDEYENSKLAWEKKMLLQKTTEMDQDELKAVKEAYNQLQEEDKHLSISVDHQAEDIQNYEIGQDQESKTQENCLSRTVSEISLVKVASLHEDVCLEPEESSISPHNNSGPTRRPVKGIPDESAAYCQRAGKDGCSHDESSALKVSVQVDGAATKVSPSTGPDILVLCASDKILRLKEVNGLTNQLSNSCAETKTIVCESEAVCNTVDKGCPSNQARSCLTKLSGPETRSVYEVNGDPLALEQKDETLEQNLCISEVTEPQTSDKHIDSQRCSTSQGTKTESNEIKDQADAPEFLHSLSQTEDQANTERLSEDKTANSSPQNTADVTRMTKDVIAERPNPCQETTHQEPEPPHDSAFPGATTSLDTHHHGSILGTAADSVEAISENKDQKDAEPTFALCTQTLKAQQSEITVSSEAVSLHPNITDPGQDASSPDGFPKANNQSDVDHKCMSAVGTSSHAGNKRYQPSFAWDTFIKEKQKKQPKCGDGNIDHSVVSRNRKSSLTLPPSTPSKSEQRSSGFLNLELVSPFVTKDKLTKKAIMKTPDKDTPSKRPHQKSDDRGEWNAIKQSFSEMFAEKENRVLISYSSTLRGSPASSFAGNGLRQDTTPTVLPPKLQSLETESQPVAEEEQNPSDIVAQIAKIEQFMLSEGLTPPKIRKID